MDRFNESVEKLKKKLSIIQETGDFSYLFGQIQNNNEVVNYYNINRLPYRIFHDYRGFMHMGISLDGIYRRGDLLAQVNTVSQNIRYPQVKKVLEFGSGFGANLGYLARLFPRVKFFGLDICQHPLRRYRKYKNIDFYSGSFDSLESINLSDFDLAYAIEAICHSGNLEKFFSGVYKILSSQSILITFDGYYLKEKDGLPEMLKTACSLTEKSMAVNSFFGLDYFKSQAVSAGFKLVKEVDFSKEILPTLRRFESLAGFYFRYPAIARLIKMVAPEKFVRNSLAGYIMPDLIRAKIAGYYLHIFSKHETLGNDKI